MLVCKREKKERLASKREIGEREKRETSERERDRRETEGERGKEKVREDIKFAMRAFSCNSSLFQQANETKINNKSV